VSSKGIKLDFKFDVTNPNPVGARIASLDYDLQINGARVAKGRSQRAIELPASGTSEVLFPYELQFQDLVSTLKALLSLKTKVPYRLDLVIAVDTPIGIIEVSRRAEGEFDLPQPKLTGAGLPF
jgi:LEA14-like dessication related protein